MPLDPWSYADKSGTEHAAQTALFMWANMAERFGLTAADCPGSYTKQGVAKGTLSNRLAMGSDDRLPQLRWLHAIHNQGHGDAIRGGKARAEGVKAGVADLFLPVAMFTVGDGSVRLPQYGFYLELKVGRNTPSEIQLEFMADMRAAGYAADWATGWLEARQKILNYLQISY